MTSCRDGKEMKMNKNEDIMSTIGSIHIIIYFANTIQNLHQ